MTAGAAPSSSSSSWQRAVALLIVSLILVPALLVYIHFNYLLMVRDVLIVSELNVDNVSSEDNDNDGFPSLLREKFGGLYQRAPDLGVFQRIGPERWNWPTAATMGSRHTFWRNTRASSSSLEGAASAISLIQLPNGGWSWCFIQELNRPQEMLHNWCIDVALDTEETLSSSSPYPPYKGSWTFRSENDGGEGTTAGRSLEMSIRLPRWQSKPSPAPPRTAAVTADATASRTLFSNWSFWPFQRNQQNALFRRNPNKTRRNSSLWLSIQKSPLVSFVLNKPSTTLLLLLNIVLAYAYWNFRVLPYTVAKHYRRIVLEGELWRGLTGATAHFQPLHLGFNMMALYSLGHELEGSSNSNHHHVLYESIEFGLYNLSLIVLTTVVMMSITYARIQYQKRRQQQQQQQQDAANAVQELQETSSVGYSGVLFAWMVVASLEQPRTCPIPMMPSTCFETHTFGPFKLSWGPWVQLVVAQILLIHVSFVGHLAGLLVGYALHWDILPPLELIQPSVLVPTVLLAYHGYHQRIQLREWNNTLFEQYSVNDNDDDDDDDEGSIYEENDGPSAFVITACRMSLFGYSFSVMGGMLLVAQGVISIYSIPAILLNLVLLMAGLNGLLFRKTSLHGYRIHYARSSVLLRAAVVCALISVVTDALALGGWLAIRFGGDNRMLYLFWLVRLSVQLWTMVAVSWLLLLPDTEGLDGGVGGIFRLVLGPMVLNPSKTIHDALRRRRRRNCGTSTFYHRLNLMLISISSGSNSNNNEDTSSVATRTTTNKPSSPVVSLVI